MKKIFIALLAFTLSASAFAQDGKIPVVKEIATLEISNENFSIQVINVPKDEQNHYYFAVGHLGIGDDVVQVYFDPLFTLFVYLGDTLEEAIETMGKIQDAGKTPGKTIEVQASFAPGFPNDKLETAKVTGRKVILSKVVEFSLEREGYTRATHIQRSDVNSIASSVKFYRKLHPKEK